MITIKTSELKRFIPHAKNIKGKNIIPICDFVKLECKENRSTITKTNLSSFVIFDIESDFKGEETILIEENVLTACANYSEGDEVTITVNDGKGVIIDDGFKKLQSQYENPKNFPATDLDSEEEVNLDQDAISAMSIAKNHVSGNVAGVKNWTGFVHSVHIHKSSYVVGTNGMISYFKKLKTKMPQFFLDPETVSILGRFPHITYMTNEKWDFFKHNDVTYGFLKPETSRPAFEKVVDSFESKDSFNINKSELFSFCDMVVSTLSGMSNIPPEVVITDDGKAGVLIKYTDVSGIERAGKKVKVSKKTFTLEPILFQPKNMITVLKDIDGEEVKISKNKGNMFITCDDEPDYIGTVMELAKL